jgi:hypothetical protein
MVLVVGGAAGQDTRRRDGEWYQIGHVGRLRRSVPYNPGS